MRLDGITGYGVAATLWLGLVLAFAAPLAPISHAAVTSQQEPSGRFRVLVVPIKSEVLDDDFGEDVAEEIRDRLKEFPTHTAVEEKEFERALKRYEVKEEDLTAITARQLASRINAQVVFYGTLSKGQGSAYDVSAKFIDVKSGDEISVPQMSVTDDDDENVRRVTEQALGTFQKAVDFQRARAFCAEYVGSQQPDNALNNCNKALAINPNSVPALFNKGLAFRQKYEADETDAGIAWGDSAVHYFERVLEQQPGHRNAMQNAAYVYSRLGDADRAADLYRQYLELDPENVPVRLKVAYDLAQAGIMEEAIQIIQQGLEYDSTDVDLLQSLGDYALQYSSTDSAYVDIALQAYEDVLEIKGEETDLRVVENALAAYTRAGRAQDAIDFAQKGLSAHPDSPRLWSLYADALAKAERYADAVSAMDTVIKIDSSYANAFLKRGRLKLDLANEDAALSDFNTAIETGNATAEDVYRMFYSLAHEARKADMAEAPGHFEHAVQFAQNQEERQEAEFWWAYTYFQLGERVAKPENASLAALRRAQDFFQSAQTHFQRAGSVREQIPQLKDATNKWLLNVEARIKQLQRSTGSLR